MSRAKKEPIFASYYQKHLGDTILVCGCGYSIRQLQVKPRLITIGVNDFSRWFTPQYLLVANRPEDFSNSRYHYIRNSHAAAVFSPFQQRLNSAPQVSFKLTTKGGTDFQNLGGLPYVRNSPYIAICLAAFMGAKTIGVLGLDFSNHHFFAPSGKHPLSLELAAMNGEYQKLTQALKQKGVTLVNLSKTSNIRTIPYAPLGKFLHDGSQNGSPPKTTQRPVKKVLFRPNRKGSTMHISVEKSSDPLLQGFFNQLSKTLTGMGAKVVRIPRRAHPKTLISFVWNGRHIQPRGVAIYCEHGWLPRWHYQMSPSGINASSHCAPFVFQPKKLKSQDKELVNRYLGYLRTYGPKGYMNPNAKTFSNLPKAFLLAPLQMEGDTNIQRHAPTTLRQMQAFLDYVSWHNPNLPILFKQHPADARTSQAHLNLRLARKCDRLIPHATANIHQLLKSGRCKGIISLNSNSVHDGLIWNIPSVVLGNNIWPRTGTSPFLNRIPKNYQKMEQHFRATHDCRIAYCLHLIRNQWTLQDIRDPKKLAAFFKQCTAWLDRASA